MDLLSAFFLLIIAMFDTYIFIYSVISFSYCHNSLMNLLWLHTNNTIIPMNAIKILVFVINIFILYIISSFFLNLFWFLSMILFFSTWLISKDFSYALYYCYWLIFCLIFIFLRNDPFNNRNKLYTVHFVELQFIF